MVILRYRLTPVRKEPIMATPTEYIKLTGTLLRATEKAVHFRVEEVDGTVLEDPVTHWFPISQIKSQTTGDADGRDHIKVAEWLCRSKELV
jgi:hypothetical protein